MILQGKDPQECNYNIKETVTLFLKLGFNIHLEKSVLVPTQELNFLGFTINSHTMTVTLPLEKKTKLKDLCLQVLGYSRPKIRLVAKLIGKFVSSLPGVDFGKLHYRNLERDKIEALKYNKGNYEGLMCLSDVAKEEIQWWIENIQYAVRSIHHSLITCVFQTDASAMAGASNVLQTARYVPVAYGHRGRRHYT